MFNNSFPDYIHYIKGQAGPIYLILNSDNITVIDIGFPSDAKSIIRYVKKELARDVNDIKLIILTHAHLDHVNGVDYLINRTGACVTAHINAKKYLTGEKAIPKASFVSYIKFFIFLARNKFPRPSISDICHMPWSGIPGFKKGINSKINWWLEEGKQIPYCPDWEVIHTPGHTDDGICLFNKKENILFSGDTVIKDKEELKLNHLLALSERDLNKSFDKLLKLPPVKNLYPGWGIPVAGKDILKGVQR